MSTIKKLKEAGEWAFFAGMILGSPITVTAYIAYLLLSGKLTWKEVVSHGGGTSEPPKKAKRKRGSNTARRRPRRSPASKRRSLIQEKE